MSTGSSWRVRSSPRRTGQGPTRSSSCPRFHDLRFVSFGGPDADANGVPDWKDYRAAESSALGELPLESLVSPLCIEGRDLWRDILDVEVEYPETNATFATVKTIGDGFYTDIPLPEDGTATISLRDRSLGWGDDFAFRKDRMLNRVDPAHLREAELDTRPEQFRSLELAESRRRFNEFCNDWFRHLYFSLAPLLCIPLYQQMRTHATIYRKAADRAPSAPEHESIANYHGEEAFRHPDCATRSLLKAALRHQDGGAQVVEITAHGFRAEERVDYVEKRGGDGFLHDVPVEWTEYLPVERTSPLRVLDAEGRSLPRHEAEANAPGPWRDALLRWNPAGAGVW